jgi:hypothetical protein
LQHLQAGFRAHRGKAMRGSLDVIVGIYYNHKPKYTVLIVAVKPAAPLAFSAVPQYRDLDAAGAPI